MITLYVIYVIYVYIWHTTEFHVLSRPHNLGKHPQRLHKPRLGCMTQDMINFQVCKELFGGDSNKLLKYMKVIG